MNHSITTVSGKTKIKIVLLGNANVGKTSIIDQFINHRFQQTANPTVGIDFLAKNMHYQGKNYRLQLWDTAGQERFRALIPNYLKDSYCALLIYDVTSKASFAEIQMWKKMFEEHVGDEKCICLVANKIDLEYRQITAEEGKKRSQTLKIPYFEISAKTGDNVDFLFESVIDYYNKKTVQSTTLFSQSEKPNHSSSGGIEVVQEQKQQKEQEQNAKESTQKTDAKIVSNEQTDKQVIQDNIVLKNNKTTENKRKQKQCC